MDPNTIVQAINSVVRQGTAPYTDWTIGLTHDPNTRRDQHAADGEEVKYWHQWQADSLNDAQKIESSFINQMNMKGGTGGNLSHHKRVFVYIF